MKKLFSIVAAVLFAGSMFATEAALTAGTNGSSITVNGNAGIKCGTSKAAGNLTISVGNGATTLTFYAAAWNKEASELTITAPEGVTVTPASVDLTADSGIAGSTSDFTLAGTEADFKFEFALSGVSSDVDLTVTAGKRFVVWSAAYTTGEGGEQGGEEGGEGGEQGGEGGQEGGEGGEQGGEEGGEGGEQGGATEAALTAGTNGSSITVNGNAGIKCGTSKAAGNLTISVGNGATTLTFYAAAWNKEASELTITAPEGVTVTPASVDLTADSGIAGSTSDFTLAGTEADFKFEFALSGVSSDVDLTVTAGKRFVLWSAAYSTGESGEGGEGGDDPVQETIKDPVIAGNASFQEEVSVTITCETEDAEIHYTLDGSDPNADSPLYEEALTLTATTTVKAIAIKDELVSEIVDKTFTLFPTELTCAEGAEAALSVSGNNVAYADGLSFSVTGYVTSIATAWSSQHKNVSFWIADEKEGGQVLEAYRAACENEEDAPGVGDLVTVTGTLTKYGSTPEFAAGCTFVIEERDEPAKNLGAKSIAEFLEMKNSKDTCVLTGIVANIKMDGEEYNQYGNFDLVDENDENVKVYIYGLLTAAGETKQFRNMGIDAGDLLTLKAVYGEHNGEPQAPNAIFVKVVKNETTGISNTAVEVKVQKVIRDGQLYIMRNGVLYNANGAVVK